MDPDDTTEKGADERAPQNAEYKLAPAVEIHAVDGGADGAGVFEAIVSVFGNVDTVGDRMVKGCFAETLRQGWPAPVWTHDWDTPPIGACLGIEERDEGLWTRTQLFLDVSPTAAQIHAALTRKSGDGRPPLREFSFAFRPYPGGQAWLEEPDNPDADPWGEVRELRSVELFEYGPTLIGANRSTRLLDAKSIHAARRQAKQRVNPKTSPAPAPADSNHVMTALLGRR